MAEEHHIRTATMARIYTQQGHYRKAAEIYRHLLNLEPSRQDIAGALAEVEKMLEEPASADHKDLAPLVRKWVRLAVRCRQVRQLRRMEKKFSQIKAYKIPDT